MMFKTGCYYEIFVESLHIMESFLEKKNWERSGVCFPKALLTNYDHNKSNLQHHKVVWLERLRLRM